VKPAKPKTFVDRFADDQKMQQGPMLRTRIKETLRHIAIGLVWALLLFVGFLAMDYQDDLLLSAYIFAGASGLTALIVWFLK
jgi:hypothetical protein